MERIKEALERARRERSAVGAWRGGGPVLDVNCRATIGDVGSIVYTRTRSVELSPALLSEKRVVLGTDASPYVDAYKILRTQVLQRMQEHGWNALAITSPGRGEGKSLTAVNLAVSLAMEVDKTVLLVDADLREPRLHTFFGIESEPGLSDYLISHTPLEDILVHPNIGRFVVLPGGRSLVNSSEMLASPRMADLVQELKSRYPSRYIIFDLPPLLNAADVLAFSPHVDAALLVIEDARTRRDDVIRAAQLLGATHLLGTVLNKSRDADKLRDQPRAASVAPAA
jgi:exopolysaccharide/PEP-CTERM locus tyrosine autokinase